MSTEEESTPALAALGPARLEAIRLTLAQGDGRRAREAAQAWLQVQPGHPEVQLLAAASALALGDPAQALEEARSVLADAQPAGTLRLRGEASRLQAHALLALGRTAEALEAFLQALDVRPGDGELRQWAGTLLLAEGRFAEARPHLEAALPLRPRDGALWAALGAVLARTGERRGAEEALRRAIQLQPRDPEPLLALAQFLADAGRIPDTAPLLRRVLELRPGLPAAVSGLLGTALYDPTLAPEDLGRLHRAWCAAYEARVAPLPPPASGWEPDRPLRVAYLSADFREHSCAAFLEPLLRAHDRAAFLPRLYHASRIQDARTQVFRGLAEAFVDVTALGDADLAARLREDRVDVLVDLSGHSAFNRLPVLAWRPAPVQLTWLGYPCTTGFQRLDGRVTDSLADPPGSEAWCSEPVLRLDPCYLCWQPPVLYPGLDLPPARGEAGRPFTFGSFNQFAKLNPAVLETWSAILRELPQARLVLKGKGAEDPVLVERIRAGFLAGGVAPHRLAFLPFTEGVEAHLRAYHGVDLALDPFPYNGVTTTLEALWMGVPVLTLEGVHSIARQGSALLRAAGLPGLVARDPQGYVSAATALARDPAALAGLRAGLRERLLASPLCDAPGFTRRMEGLYRSLWRRACAAQGGSR